METGHASGPRRVAVLPLRVLLLRPRSPNERFGLGPFFRVEPLGLEYLGAALRGAGHHVALADLRFGRSLAALLRSFRPQVVAVTCTHAVDVPAVLAVVEEAKRRAPDVFTVVGGHAASAHPEPLFSPNVDALCVGDGEHCLVQLVDELARGNAPYRVPGLWARRAPGQGRESFEPPEDAEQRPLDDVPLPARDLVAPARRQYLCVHKMPIWAVETTRGCPYRCTFCSVWRHNDRAFRQRSIDWVAQDLAHTGPHVFVVDDLFWQPSSWSLELARELRRRGIRKDWMLVQARVDTVARQESLLAEWRPLAKDFDIFFGFETPSDRQLAQLDKGLTQSDIEAGVGVARGLGYGVTGNFLVDPEWTEGDFEAMWELVDRLRLDRAGFTILTPLPGTVLFEQKKALIRERDWSHYDMHHLLFEPSLGRERFFALFVESWRRNVLNAARSREKLWKWARGLTPRQLLQLARVLNRTQRLLDVNAYLREAFPATAPAATAWPDRDVPNPARPEPNRHQPSAVSSQAQRGTHES